VAATSRRALFYQRRARAEVRAAYRWYENEKKGLGERFLAALRESENRIQTLPLSFPVVYRTTRRVFLKRFPYGLLFRLENDEVIVVACYHVRRDPEGWMRR